MTTREAVGRRIREAREELGLSQTDLGKRLKRARSHAAVSDMERGEVRLDVEELSNLAQVLNKSLAYFLDTDLSRIYRRGEYGQTEDGKRQTSQAIEDFRQYARKQVGQKQDRPK